MKHLLLSALAASCLAWPTTGYPKDKHGGGQPQPPSAARPLPQRAYSQRNAERGNFTPRSNSQQNLQRYNHSAPRRYAQQGSPQRPNFGARNYRSRNRNFTAHSPYSGHGYQSYYKDGHYYEDRDGDGHFNHRDGDNHQRHYGYGSGDYGYGGDYFGYGNGYYGYGRGYYPYSYPYCGPSYGYGYYPRTSFGVSYYAEPSYSSRGYLAESGDSLAAEVQRELQRRGYYRGYIDGEIGAGSRAAIRNYQADHELPRTGRIDSRLLRSLGVG